MTRKNPPAELARQKPTDELAELNRTKALLEVLSLKPVFSKSEFAMLHGISPASLENYIRAGNGPRLMRTAGRVLISREAAADWRKQLETTPLPGHGRARRSVAA